MNARLEACLDTIERLEPAINAFQVVRAERVRREAQEIAGESERGAAPLAGVPIAVKDNIDVAGEPTRHGSAASPAQAAIQDSEPVARLRAAGCLIVGKTKMPELAIWPFTESAAYGVTRNPWSADRSPGGSSGGSAAAVAAGMVPLALGSDGGGSIRIPAACCGLFGLKPTPGLLPMPSHWYGLSAWGPIAGSVADAALMLDVLAGTTRFRDPRPPSRPLRLALSFRAPVPMTVLDPEVKQAVEICSSLLQQRGHALELSDPPYTTPTPYLRRYLAGIAAEAASFTFSRLERRTQGMVRMGRFLQRRWPPGEDDARAWRGKLARWFERYDALLLPAVPGPAPRVEKWKGKGWPRTLLEVSRELAAFTAVWNLAAYPAATIPAGVGSNGLPLALQVVAPPGEEDTILALAAQLESLRPWPRHAPDPPGH